MRNFQNCPIRTKTPYYLVSNSPSPFFIAMSLFSVMLCFLNKIVSVPFFADTFFLKIFFYSNLILLVGALSNSVYDLLTESTYLGFFTTEVQQNFRLGFQLFIISEIMLFFAFFSTFFYFWLNPPASIGLVWPPYGIHVLNPWTIPLLNTFILLVSGLFLTSAKVTIMTAAQPKFPYLDTTLICWETGWQTEFWQSKNKKDWYYLSLDWLHVSHNFYFDKLNWLFGWSYWKAWPVKMVGFIGFQGSNLLQELKYFILMDKTFQWFLRDKTLLMNLPELFFDLKSNSCWVTETWQAQNYCKPSLSWGSFNYYWLSFRICGWLVVFHLFYWLWWVYTTSLFICFGFGMNYLKSVILSSRSKVPVVHILSLFAMKSYYWTSIFALSITVSLGLLFSFFQLYEYCVATFSINDSIYGSIFYILTGLHGLHVLGGTSFLLFNLSRLYCGHFTTTHHLSFDCAIWYSHFVDVVSLVVFVCVYSYGGY